MLIEDAVSPGTPQFVIDSYATLAERAKTQSFGLIEEDVIVLDTETTGLSVQDNELIEISAARLSGREVIDRFDTFVHPKQLIPAEITELTSITTPMWQMLRRPSRPSRHSPTLWAAVLLSRITPRLTGRLSSRSRAVSTSATSGSIRWHCRASHFRAWPRTSCLLWPTCLGAIQYRTCDADVDALCGVWRVLLVALTTCFGPYGALGGHARGRALVISPHFFFFGWTEPGFDIFAQRRSCRCAQGRSRRRSR